MSTPGREPILRLFVSGTDTDAGKTRVTLALAAFCAAHGLPCRALKPIETGCDPVPIDAQQLAEMSGDAGLADAPGFVRLVPPLAPRAVQVADPAVPELDVVSLGARVAQLLEDTPPGCATLVEGAGGLLVPLNRTEDTADLIVRLAMPLVLVASNRLGVLSHCLSAAAVCAQRGLPLLAVVLNQLEPEPDLSTDTNATVLRERLACPVLEFPHTPHGDAPTLARAAAASGLPTLLGWERFSIR